MQQPPGFSNPSPAEPPTQHQTLPDNAQEHAKQHSGSGAVEQTTFTLAEVATHNRPDSAWVAVDGKVHTNR